MPNSTMHVINAVAALPAAARQPITQKRTRTGWRAVSGPHWMLLCAATLTAIVPRPTQAQSGSPLNLAAVSNWNRVKNTYTGNLEAFEIAPNGELVHNWQTADGWNGWDTCAFAGLQVSQFTVGQNRGGTLEVFAVDNNNQSWHSWQVPSGGTQCGWSGWNSLASTQFLGNGAEVTTPVVSTVFRLPLGAAGFGNGQNLDGALEVFTNWLQSETANTWVLTAWQAPSGGTGGWQGWSPVGDNTGNNFFGTIAAASLNTNGVQEIFMLWGGAVRHIAQAGPNSPEFWQSLEFLGGGPNIDISQVVVGQNYDGRLEAFALTNHGSVYHVWQTTAGSTTSWGTTWVPLGSGFNMKQIAVGQDYEGELEVFGVTDHGSPYHLFQTSPGGAWTNWESLGCGGYSATALAVAQNSDGRLEVFDRNADGNVFHIWQLPGAEIGSPNDPWSCFTQL